MAQKNITTDAALVEARLLGALATADLDAAAAACEAPRDDSDLFDDLVADLEA